MISDRAASIDDAPAFAASPRVAAAPDELPIRLRLGWSVGTLGPVTLLYVVNYALLFFMTNVLGISASVAGAVIFGTRLLDLAIDLAVGVLSDRTRSRWGRRRPSMLAGAVVSCLGCALLFNVPAAWAADGAAAPGPLLAWAGVALTLYFTGYSMFNVPYMAMPAEMTGSFQERTRLMSLRVSFVALAGLVGISLASWLVGRFGGGLAAYGGMALVMTAISLAAMLASVVGTAGAAQTEASSVRMAFGEQMRIVLSNRPFMVLIFSKLMLLLALSAITTSLYYVVTQIMQRGPSALSLYGIVQNAGILVSLRFWVWLGRRHSKQALFAAAVLGGVPLSLSWLLASPSEPLWVFGLRAGLLGFFAGGSLVMGQSMLPDTIDFDHQRSGMRREGVFSAIYSFVEKASFAAGPLIVGSLLGAFGYVASRTGAAPATQTPEALRAIYIGVAIVPAVAALVAAASLRFYTLTEQSLRPAPQEKPHA